MEQTEEEQKKDQLTDEEKRGIIIARLQDNGIYRFDLLNLLGEISDLLKTIAENVTKKEIKPTK